MAHVHRIEQAGRYAIVRPDQDDADDAVTIEREQPSSDGQKPTTAWLVPDRDSLRASQLSVARTVAVGSRARADVAAEDPGGRAPADQSRIRVRSRHVTLPSAAVPPAVPVRAAAADDPEIGVAPATAAQAEHARAALRALEDAGAAAPDDGGAEWPVGAPMDVSAKPAASVAPPSAARSSSSEPTAPPDDEGVHSLESSSLPSTPWARRRSVMMAACTLAGFACGVLVGVGSARGFGDGSGVALASDSKAPTEDPATARAPSPPADPAATPDQQPAGALPVAPSTGSHAQCSGPLDAKAGATLPAGHGYLLVCSPASDARVYVGGKAAGAVAEPIRVRCGGQRVRLGAVPLTGWLSAVVPVQVACQSVTRIAIEPLRAMRQQQPGAPASSAVRFEPSDL